VIPQSEPSVNNEIVLQGDYNTFTAQYTFGHIVNMLLHTEVAYTLLYVQYVSKKIGQ